MPLRVRVCSIDELAAGELRAFRVDGVTWPVVIAIIDGAIVAFPGVCPHEDVELATGELEGATVICPGHGYHFDLHSGRCEHDPTLTLRRYPTTQIGADIWVDLL